MPQPSLTISFKPPPAAALSLLCSPARPPNKNPTPLLSSLFSGEAKPVTPANDEHHLDGAYSG
ncbi:hypothetical protein KY290_027292 [Solanum tuberosum]|uniref:Uncharacterized protein n=1 Tax=Solanum tuberosum TaxID=4113 RepID=A0ABQ7UHW1_SOLTU|nr:hypothetical protein KY290_027292 [Solanum tuberosum]